MFYSIFGKLIVKEKKFLVCEVNGIGFKISVSEKTLRRLPKIGSKIRFFCHIEIGRDSVDLYGFLTENELKIFELLLSIDGIGPKVGLKILEIAKIEKLLAAIKNGRSDLLEKAAGIGTKKAQRIVLELKDKISGFKNGEEEIKAMDSDDDVEKALKSVGYKKSEIKEAIENIPSKIKKIEERLKFTLKFLATK